MRHQPFTNFMRTQIVRAIAASLVAFGGFQPALLPARSIIPPGEETVWRFLEGGTGPDAAWFQPGFDDSHWKTGKAPIGFGETRIGTLLESKPFTAWFRHKFDSPRLQPGEGLVILLCVDDGAIVYLNGKELARTNLPSGPVKPHTAALETIAESDEGWYHRIHVPVESLRTGAKNVLAIEVHNVSSRSSDLYFDLGLKTVPAETAPHIRSDASQVVGVYRKQHYVGPELRVPDGYMDGGRDMEVDAGGNASSEREILFVDREHDAELADDLAFARSAKLRALPELDRIQKIAERIDRETTPLGGLDVVDQETDELEKDYDGKAILIGDWVDQCHAGVCRHRSLLFKLLADEAGLKAALVRGNYLERRPPTFGHAWNEIFLADGRRLLVDVMHNGSEPVFRPLTDPYVIKHYRKVDDSPWYPAGAAE
jgi:hypothetical protein